MKKSQIKVGMSVLSVTNSAWGLKVMKVTHFDKASGHVSCKHPEIIPTGGFQPSDLEPVTAPRLRAIGHIADLEDEIAKLKKQWFRE